MTGEAALSQARAIQIGPHDSPGRAPLALQATWGKCSPLQYPPMTLLTFPGGLILLAMGVKVLVRGAPKPSLSFGTSPPRRLTRHRRFWHPLSRGGVPCDSMSALDSATDALVSLQRGDDGKGNPSRGRGWWVKCARKSPVNDRFSIGAPAGGVFVPLRKTRGQPAVVLPT